MLRTPQHSPISSDRQDQSQLRPAFAMADQPPGPPAVFGRAAPRATETGEAATSPTPALASGQVPTLPATRTSSGRRQPRSRTAAADDARAIRVAVAQEAHDISLLVAVTGSIVNAIVASKRPQLRTAMAAYLPGLPSLFTASIGSNGAAAALPTTTMQSLIAYYGLINFARSATLGYSAKREPGGIAGPISMETLGEAWQAAATQAIGTLSLLGYLDKESVLFSVGRDNAAAARLIEMLWGVTLGRSPCVRIDGAVIIPGWIERRSHLRREINAPALLTLRGAEQRVIVRDLSAGGIGVEGATGVSPGDRVRVSLGTGMLFDGLTVWQRDNRIGVQLLAPPTTASSPDGI